MTNRRKRIDDLRYTKGAPSPQKGNDMNNETRAIELETLVKDIRKWEDIWQKSEKELAALDNATQDAFNQYDDLALTLRALVEETLVSGATIKITLDGGKVHTVAGRPKDIVLCWENVQWMRYVDGRNYWKGFNWAAVSKVDVG